MKIKHLYSLCFSATLIWASGAMASPIIDSSISPASFSATLDVSDSITIHKSITLASDSSTLDLVFGTDFFSIYPGGLAFSFTCTDAFGCTDVSGGETRTFDVTITALAMGTYDFTIGASDVSARESDYIVVNPTAVPEPTTLSLLGLGLAGIGVMRRRRGWRIAA